jgi:SAM-dependent methyltransferase
MAERWAEFLHETPELAFLQQQIARYGQPVLDLACGTGRLLIPLLQAGLDVDGCDLSGDMLAHCRQRAAHLGLAPRLHEQSMHAFDLPRRYRTIYLCDSFGLTGGREDDLETLRRCYAHLDPGSALIVNIEAEYALPETWALWVAENRRSLPQPWPEEGSRRMAADGSEHRARFRFLGLDPLEQTYTREVRLEKWVGEKLVKEETYTLRGRMYFKSELELMLQIAGFRQITVRGDYRNELATAAHKQLIFTAVK